MNRAPKFTGPSSKAFVKFLGLAHAAALESNAHDLNAPAIAMLNTLAQSWLAGVAPNVLAAMHANNQSFKRLPPYAQVAAQKGLHHPCR